MTRLARIALGVLLGLLGCAAVVHAQTGPGDTTVSSLLGGLGFLGGAGALVAVGRKTEKLDSHSDRLKAIEDDRVTRVEFETMGGTIRNIESDVRQIREMLERRQITRNP